MESFKNLGIEDAILRSIEEKCFEAPTEIQEMAIPLILEGKDIIGGAATGSGKTLAFGCGIIQKIERGQGIGALVLTPTRELAEQVHNSLKEFSRHKKLKIASVYGGVAIGPQVKKLGKADIVVATPGRLLDHIGRGTIDLDNVEMLVLDEADRMLDMGFIDDVEEIVMECPDDRQTLLFSATVSKDIKYLSRKYMNDPQKVFAKAHVDSSKLEQTYYDVPKPIKFSLLVHLLKSEKSGLVMVFCNTRSNVDFVQKNLRKNGVDAIAIHGGHTQAKRKSTLSKFHSNEAHALVCTDVAARGLDIPYVSHVYNYDIPEDVNEYVHRIGRTARAGREGKVINVVTDREADAFGKLVRHHRKFTITKEDLPEVERVIIKDEKNKRHDKNSFKRGGKKSGGRGKFKKGEGRGESKKSEKGEGQKRTERRDRRERSGKTERSSDRKGFKSSGESRKSKGKTGFKKRTGVKVRKE
ncbi:DEAD/DEAH box helicase [Methanococcoides methylutens]|uniref:Cold-shock DEAD-box protein A n=1 Tax=Methanococcoides methylutens MM1 TaxID=1434104 RepID=A0A0E3SNV8_METMT|nr:DEAD/DEAH box helicase [Methanococcoides methylutens]AKB84226.1 Cold-shock DEAD-box protein A [Methanococcoides methylutens MM1]